MQSFIDSSRMCGFVYSDQLLPLRCRVSFVLCFNLCGLIIMKTARIDNIVMKNESMSRSVLIDDKTIQ